MRTNVLYDTKIIAVSNAVVAGTTAVTTAVVDMQGYDSVAFVVKTGIVTSGSVLTLSVKTNSASSVTSPVPATLATTVTFTAGATDATNKLLELDIDLPRQRYVFAVLTRTTANAVIDGIFAVLYNAHNKPVTIDPNTIASAFVSDPA